MELAHRWISRDLTKLELVVSLMIIGIFIGLFAKYALTVFATVEKKMIERTIINIETAMNHHAAVLLLKKDNLAFNNLLQTNPIELMSNQKTMNEIYIANNMTYDLVANRFVPPENYAGLVLDDSSNELEEGVWYYDFDDKFLFYTVRNDEMFKSFLPGPSRIRYKTVIQYEDKNDDKEYTMDRDVFKSIKLVNIDNAVWPI